MNPRPAGLAAIEATHDLQYLLFAAQMPRTTAAVEEWPRTPCIAQRRAGFPPPRRRLRGSPAGGAQRGSPMIVGGGGTWDRTGRGGARPPPATSCARAGGGWGWKGQRGRLRHADGAHHRAAQPEGLLPAPRHLRLPHAHLYHLPPAAAREPGPESAREHPLTATLHASLSLPPSGAASSRCCPPTPSLLTTRVARRGCRRWRRAAWTRQRLPMACGPCSWARPVETRAREEVVTIGVEIPCKLRGAPASEGADLADDPSETFFLP